MVTIGFDVCSHQGRRIGCETRCRKCPTPTSIFSSRIARKNRNNDVYI